MSFSIIPRRVFETSSPISGKITVEEQLGLYSLSVQGLIQSGGLVKSIWKHPLNRIQDSGFRIQDCLILGLGGGTVAWLIHERWPQAKITGVEIDPEIIKIGKKYFALGKIESLEIINVDAFQWLDTLLSDLTKYVKKYDLVIVDLYLGNKFPLRAEKADFFKQLKKIIAQNGVIIFNRLKLQRSVIFEKKLKEFFGQLNSVETPTNTFSLLQK